MKSFSAHESRHMMCSFWKYPISCSFLSFFANTHNSIRLPMFAQVIVTMIPVSCAFCSTMHIFGLDAVYLYHWLRLISNTSHHHSSKSPSLPSTTALAPTNRMLPRLRLLPALHRRDRSGLLRPGRDRPGLLLRPQLRPGGRRTRPVADHGQRPGAGSGCRSRRAPDVARDGQFGRHWRLRW